MAQKSSRNQPLDILRGIAVLLVLGYHYKYVAVWSKIGWMGVDLFFVLSGFLISGLLFNEYKRFGNIRMGRFLIRRGFKIYPAFYVLVIFTGVDCLMTQGRIPKAILGEVFFLQNYWMHMWPHTWSLAVEEHFYWMLPVLLIVMTKKSKNKENPFGGIPWVFVGLAITCLALRVLENSWGVQAAALKYQTHLRIDSLFAGVALGYYRHFRPELFARAAQKPLWVPGLLLLVPAFIFNLGTPVMDTIGFSSLYAGFSCLVVWAVEQRASRARTARSLAWTGRYSYSIYLWHFPIGFLVFNGSPSLPLFLLYLATAVGFGAGMSELIEVPHLKLRDRWFPSRSSAKVSVRAAKQPVPVQELATSR